MRRLALLAALAGATTGCAPAAPPARRAPTTTTTPTLLTTTAAATTTTLAPTSVPPTTARRLAPVVTTTTVVAEGNEGAQGDDFWRRLANCECASGRCDGPHVSYFQFSPDTAAKVGIDGSESYEEQRAAAQEWARRIHPREGTSSGWPHCWGVAA